MTVALFCPKWACGAGIFSPDPVTMETAYIGHGEALHFNCSDFGSDKTFCFCFFLGFFMPNIYCVSDMIIIQAVGLNL